ncbi:MAG: hypothetical protein K2Q22_14140, partial [Cytophagales bacterium]|nr:hypothetical protein [Cytophagales bacterium]
MKMKGYAQDPNISLGIGNKIHPTAELNVYQGGKISLGEGNEIMPHVMLMTYGGTIEIGNYCSINPFT